ncbi:hypothetical protein M5689_024003 [Euphorbia peplus]|nr:hypothetical protein M5689_024003 [Euphorbia peplus]
MEKIADHLKQAKLMQESIWKSYDEAHIDSPHILSFARKWRDVEDQLELANFSLWNHGQELDLKSIKIVEATRLLDERNKQVELKLDEVEARLDGLRSENRHISLLSEMIEHFSLELISKEKKLNLVQKDVEDCNQMLRTKMGELELVVKSHEACNEELTFKEKQLVTIENSIQVKNEELTLKKNQLDTIENSIQVHNEELKLTESKLGGVKIELEGCCKDLAVKNNELESVKKSLQVHYNELEMKEHDVENVNIEIEWKEKELSTKKKQLDTIVTTIEESKEEFQLEDNKLRSVKEQLETMKKQQLSLKKSITDYSEQLETMKQQQLSLEKSIKDYAKEVESKRKNLDLVKTFLKDLTSKEAEVNSMQMKNCDFRKELEEKGKNFDALKKTLEERSTKLETKEKQFEARLREIELKEQQIDAICQYGKALESLKHKSHLQAHGQEYSATVKSESSTSIDQNTCPLILPSDMGDGDLTPNEVLSVLKSSPDPADFVLSLMQGSYSQQDANVKSKNLLLEKLIEVSPRINLVVQTKAVKLAVSWKENLSLGTENSMEVWLFLLFLAAYRIANRFGWTEILRLLLVVSDQRRAPLLCQILSFTEKAPEIIQILMERKQHIDAARFSSAFGLLHEFPLESSLQNCVEHIKAKAIDEELSALKASVQCISDYKLESRYDAQNIARRIRELEMEKQCSRPSTFSLVLPSLKPQPLQHSGYYRTLDVATSKDHTFPDVIQLQPGVNNKHKIAEQSYLTAYRITI